MNGPGYSGTVEPMGMDFSGVVEILANTVMEVYA